jgi:hypothetical protein
MTIERKQRRLPKTILPRRAFAPHVEQSPFDRKELKFPYSTGAAEVSFRLVEEHSGPHEYRTDNGFELCLRKTHFIGEPPTELSMQIIGLPTSRAD